MASADTRRAETRSVAGLASLAAARYADLRDPHGGHMFSSFAPRARPAIDRPGPSIRKQTP